MKSPDQDAIALPWNPASRTQSSSRAEKLWCHSGGIHGHRGPRDQKAEQLFACPGSGSIFPYKTEVCDFIAREKAFETAIADDICENVGKFSILLFSSCERVVRSA